MQPQPHRYTVHVKLRDQVQIRLVVVATDEARALFRADDVLRGLGIQVPLGARWKANRQRI